MTTLSEIRLDQITRTDRITEHDDQPNGLRSESPSKCINHPSLVYKATSSRSNEDIKKIQSDFSVEFRPGAPPPFDFPQNHSHQLEVLLKFAAGSNFILTMSIESILSVS